jgi:hypothetical protein
MSMTSGLRGHPPMSRAFRQVKRESSAQIMRGTGLVRRVCAGALGDSLGNPGFFGWHVPCVSQTNTRGGIVCRHGQTNQIQQEKLK